MRSLVTLSASALLLVACSSSEPATSEDAPAPVESPSAPAELPEVPSATDPTPDLSAPPASPVEGGGEVVDGSTDTGSLTSPPVSSDPDPAPSDDANPTPEPDLAPDQVSEEPDPFDAPAGTLIEDIDPDIAADLPEGAVLIDSGTPGDAPAPAEAPQLQDTTKKVQKFFDKNDPTDEDAVRAGEFFLVPLPEGAVVVDYLFSNANVTFANFTSQSQYDAFLAKNGGRRGEPLFAAAPGPVEVALFGEDGEVLAHSLIVVK